MGPATPATIIKHAWFNQGEGGCRCKKDGFKKKIFLFGHFLVKKITNKPGNRGQASDRIQDHYVDRSVLKICKS